MIKQENETKLCLIDKCKVFKINNIFCRHCKQCDEIFECSHERQSTCSDECLLEYNCNNQIYKTNKRNLK